MRKFTVKDFITTYSSCLTCGKASKIRINSCKFEELTDMEIKPTFDNSYLDINLRLAYREILKLRIYYTSNRFETSNIEMLKKYFETHSIQLVSRCWTSHYLRRQTRQNTPSALHTSIVSNWFDFNYDRMHLIPFEMEEEFLCVWDKRNIFNVISSYEKNKTTIIVSELERKINPAIVENLKIELPLMRLHKFKTKKQFLDKLNVCLTFS